LLGWKGANQVEQVAVVDRMAYDAIVGDAGRTNEEERRRARNLVVRVLNEMQSRKGLQITEYETIAAMRKAYTTAETNVGLVVGPEFYRRVQELTPANMKSRLEDGLSSFDMTLEAAGPTEDRITSESDETKGSTFHLIEHLVFSNTFFAVLPHVLCEDRSGNVVQNAALRLQCRDLQAELDGPLRKLNRAPETESVQDDAVYRELIPGFTVMFVFFLVNIMARSFIQEREIGTLRRLRMAPVRPSTLLAGKTIPFFIVSVLQTVVLFVFGKLIFDMWWGSRPALLVPVMLATSLAATALGLLIATLVRTDSQVSAYANFVVITLAGISGCFMPRDWLPEAMQTVSLATPHAWALKAYDQLLQKESPDLTMVLAGCGMLLVFAAAFFALGAWRFRRVES
ncbi:MAG: ABC transporter permease, partial [Planctomycetes bacterium]|nr:ABC transporter permease [Planctomycetota bacterium]